MNGVERTGHTGDGVKQHKDVLAGLDKAAAAIDHQAREAHVGLEVLVVGRGNHLGIDRSGKVGDLLGALVDQQHDCVNVRMIGGHGVGDLLEDGRLTGTRRCHDQATGALADWRDEIDDPRLEHVRRGLELEFFDRIDRGEILEAHHAPVFLERNAVDADDLLELWAGAAVGRLQFAFDQRAFADGGALDRVRGHEDVGRLGLVIVVG